MDLKEKKIQYEHITINSQKKNRILKIVLLDHVNDQKWIFGREITLFCLLAKQAVGHSIKIRQ